MTFFKGCNIAVTGDFGDAAPYSKIKRWIEAAGGSYVTRIDENVTHLVCSHDYYKKQVSSVVQASKHPRLKVVTFDWLELCLQKRRRLRPSGDFLVQSQVKQRASHKAKRRAERKDTIRDRELGYLESLSAVRTSLQVPGYQVHCDAVGGFEWDARLLKIDAASNDNRRAHLRLVETLTEPKAFGAYADFRGCGLHHTRVLAAPPREFCEARKAFEVFFRECTAVEWKERGSVVMEGKWVYDGPAAEGVVPMAEVEKAETIDREQGCDDGRARMRLG